MRGGGRRPAFSDRLAKSATRVVSKQPEGDYLEASADQRGEMSDLHNLPDFDPTPRWARIGMHVLGCLLGISLIVLGYANFAISNSVGCLTHPGPCPPAAPWSGEALRKLWLPVGAGFLALSWTLRAGLKRYLKWRRVSREDARGAD
ncbi:MAG: hypothetical protein CMO01_00755 [Thalassobius sp.]|nr:hypothetical protein [Thalassovita sp.]